MRRTIVGVKDFSGSVDITDPCYNRDVWCRINDVKIKEGTYTCVVWRHTEKGKLSNGEPYSDTRVGVIGIYLNGNIPRQKDMDHFGDIGVDAGLAGFFHHKPDYNDKEWSAFCDAIYTGNGRTGDVWLTDDGFFSSSGYGDGAYDVYAMTSDKEIVALEIRFL